MRLLQLLACTHFLRPNFNTAQTTPTMMRVALLLLAALCALAAPSHGFAPPAAQLAAGRSRLGLGAAASDDNTGGAEASSGSSSTATTYPPLSNEEIEQFLARIPVYAVTDSSTGGVVLMSERSSSDGSDGDGGASDKGIAYLFITREAATATMKQLRNTAAPGASWEVTGLSLGAIWYELLSGESTVQTQSLESGETLDTTNETIEYRLTPDYRDLNGARDLLSQSAEAKAALEKSGAFSSPYGDVPVFMDLQIRMEEQQEDGSRVERFPLYLALQDMMETCQQFVDAGGADAQGGAYEATVNVAQLDSLVQQMQAEGGSTVDWRKAMLIPPTPLPEKPVADDDDSTKEYSPSMNDSWAD